MFYYSKNSRNKIVHTEKCYIAQSFTPETTGTFENLRDAFDKGYRLCRRCNPLFLQYKREEKDIIKYCQEYGMSIEYTDRTIKVKSTMSKWLIAVTVTGGTLLYHKNTDKRNNNPNDFYPGYHNQRIMFFSLIDYLQYISSHDRYRQTHPLPTPTPPMPKYPKGSKAWRKQQKRIKNHERRSAIRRVYTIIESLEKEA